MRRRDFIKAALTVPIASRAAPFFFGQQGVDDIAPLIQNIQTDASATPTTTHITLSGSQNAVRVWTGDQSASEASFDFYLSRNGGSVVKFRMFRYQGRIISAPAGATLSFGTADGRTLKMAPCVMPGALESISGASGTANADKAGPPIWTPTAAHITLPTIYSAFQIDADGTERDIFVAEYDGTQWSPYRWLKLPSSGSVKVRCNYKQVALANYAGVALSITAPTGSMIGGAMATMSLNIPAATGTTHNVTTVAEFKTAIAAAVSGDHIVLTDGTYALDVNITHASFTANHNVGGRKGMEGIVIRSQSGIRENCVISCSSAATGKWEVNQDGATLPAYFKDLKFNFAGADAHLKMINGAWKCENVRTTGVGTSTNDGFMFENTLAKTIQIDALFCQADNAASDCFNGAGSSSSRARLIACVAFTSGVSVSDQCLTSHSGLVVEDYGGYYYDANGNVIGNDTTSTPGYLFFTKTEDGARTCGVVNYSMFACDISPGASAKQLSLTPQPNGYMLFTRYRHAVRVSSAVTWTCSHNRLIGFSGVGRGVFASVGGNSLYFNIVDTWSEGIRVDNSGAGGAVSLYGNTLINCTTALSLNDANLSITIKNNACKTNGTSVSCTATSNGNMTKGSNVLDPTVDADYSAGTGDTTGADAGLAATFIPTASGNCDGTGDTSIVDYVGASDPFGLVLIYKSNRLSRGAREIPAVYASAELYPDLW